MALPAKIDTRASVGSIVPVPVPRTNPALERAWKRLRRPRSEARMRDSAALVPLFYAAVLFLAGIVLARFLYLRPGWLLVGLALLAGVACWALGKAARVVWLPVAVIWLLLGVWAAEMEPGPGPDWEVARLSDGLLRTVEGTVTDAGPVQGGDLDAVEDSDLENSAEGAGERRQKENQKVDQRVDLLIDRAEVVTDFSDSMVDLPKAGDARIRLTVTGPEHVTGLDHARVLGCGERIRVVVRMLPPETFHDAGVWSREAYLEGQEITAIGAVNAAKADGGEPRLTLLGDEGTSSAACLLNRWKDLAAARLQALPAITKSLPRQLRATPEDAAMLTALLTGDRTYLTRGLRVGFERTGSFHLIVVSGLHLAILAGCVFAAARRLRLPRLWATGITLAATLGYALFTGFAIPAQRSFWMIALYLIGRLLYRGRSPLNVIGFATIVLAAVSPRSIFDASLQMTLLSVAPIAGIAIPLLERTLHARVKATEEVGLISVDAKLPPRIAQFRVTLRLICSHLEPVLGMWLAWQVLPLAIRCVLRLGELIFVTLVVELALALPMAMYFHRITVYALPVNLVILPLLTVLVPAAMVLLLALAVWPSVAVVPACVALGVLHFSVFVVRWLGGLALGDLRVPEPSGLQIGAALLLLLLALQLARGAGMLAGLQRLLAFVALMLMATATLWPRAVAHPQDAMVLEAIDVGQGDSLLLITPGGKTLLIDGGGIGFRGGSVQARSDFDVGEEVVSAVLWSRGIRRLDAVALTHAHHDHMGGLPAILRNFRPRELWVGKNPPVAAYRELMDEAAALGVAVRSFHAGETVQFGEAEIRVLAPDAGYRPGAQPANNDSLVLRASLSESSVLLAGDAEGPEEEAMLAEAGLRSNLLKVGHHGSLTSTHARFLAAVAPQLAVISCGRRNRFGHPRAEVLAELEAAHTLTFRTDTGGSVCFRLDGKSVRVEPLCEPSRELVHQPVQEPIRNLW